MNRRLVFLEHILIEFEVYEANHIALNARKQPVLRDILLVAIVYDEVT